MYNASCRSRTKTLGPGDKVASGKYGDTFDYRMMLSQPLKLFRLPIRATPKFDATGLQLRLGDHSSPKGRLGPAAHLPGSITQQHICLLGPSGGGKTRYFVRHWVEDFIQYQSVVMTDAKGNLNRQYGLKTMAESHGAVYLEWSLSSPESHCWNLCEEIDRCSDEVMLREISTVAKAIMGKKPENQNECFWYRDCSWMKGVLILLLVTEVSPRPSQLLPLLLDPEQVETRLGMLDTAMKQLVHNLMVEYFKIEEWELYKALFTLRDRLSCFDLPDVRRICDRASDFSLRDFNQEDHRYLLVVSQLEGREESKQLARVMSALFLSRMEERYYSPQALAPPVAFIADEAHALKETIEFKRCLAVLREAKVSMVIATQSITQFNEREQPKLGEQIAGMCHTKILLPGVDVETAEWFSNSLGCRPDVRYSRGWKPGSGTGHSGHRTKRLSPREIMERSPEIEQCAIVRQGTSSPFFVNY